jgi:oligo-1,6-glucosidase
MSARSRLIDLSRLSWLNPHYKSPQVDMGYDISDYQDIHEPYGSLDDCMALIKGCHDRGIKIVFDLVVNQ